MFPGMVDPFVDSQPCPEASLRSDIEHWSSMPGVLAWKLAGAGGGGYLVLVVEDAEEFCKDNKAAGATPVCIRR